MLQFAVFFLITLPWLNPFAPGPSPAVGPWLFSLACIAGLIGLTGLIAGRRVNHWVQGFLTPVALGWLVAGLLGSAIGLLQYFGVAGALSPWVNQTNFGEAFANLRQRNQFATLTNIALAALIWLALRRQQSNSLAKPGGIGLVIASGCLLAVGNAVSSSRTGLLQLLLLCGLWLLWGGWQNVWLKRLTLCVLAVYAAAMYGAPFLAGLDLSTHGALARMGNDEPCVSRLVLWSNVLHLIAQKPWLGWGWGELDYAHFITLYNEPRFCDILDNAHNLPLQLAVELGVPAAVLICGGFVWWAARQKPWAETDATRQMAWAVIAVILLHSMLEYPLWYGPFQMAFWICIGLLWRPKQFLEAEKATGEKSWNKGSNRPLAPVLYGQAAIILIVFAGYAAWDYRRIGQIYLPPESRAASYQTDTLGQIRGSWLFADQVQFAELLTTPLTPANAEWTFDTAEQLLHYSPEPRVIEKLIESAVLLGKDDVALAYLARFRAAFPKEHMRWAKANSAKPSQAKSSQARPS